jgi:putative transcriptional regulator
MMGEGCQMSKLGKRPINAAKSAQAIAKSQADPKTYKVHVPADLNVRAIRNKLKMSQNAFAARFGILPSTLRDWEQKRRRPDEAARVLLLVIDKEPDAVTRALAPVRGQKHIQKSTVSTFQTADYFTARAARADIPKALKVLKRAGVGKPPTKGDELPAKKKRAKRQAA